MKNVFRGIERVSFFVALLLLPHSARWIVATFSAAPIYPEFTGLLLYLNEVAAAVCVASWLLRLLANPGSPFTLPPWWVWVPWGMLIVHSLVSASWADVSSLSFDLALRWLLAFGFLAYTANEVRGWRQALWPLAVGTTVQGGIACIQFVRQAPVGLHLLGELGTHLSKPGLWVRGYGLTPHPNILGGYLSVGLLLLVGGVVATRRWQRALALTALALATSGLHTTFSRSSQLGSLLGLALIALGLACRTDRQPHHRRGFLLSGLVITIVSTAFVLYNPSYFVTRWLEPVGIILEPREPAQMTQTQANEQFSLDERSWYVDAARQMMREKPYLGVGAGNFSVALYRARAGHPGGYIYQPVHNVFYLAVAELGVLGGLWWGLLLWLPMGAALLPRQISRTVWSTAYTAALASLGVISLFDYYLWAAPHGRLLLALLLGLWCTQYQNIRGDVTELQHPVSGL